MANKIFEKKFEQKVTLDDTEKIICDIETAQNVNGHTEYVIRVQRGPLKENCWRILRRYNEFAELNKHLQISRIPLAFPGKRYVGNMRPDFIAERRQQLQEYLNTVLMNPILASSLPAKKFVDPDSYSQSFHDNAVQNTSLCLRTEGLFTLGPAFGTIGWRLRKHYFKVTQKPPEKSSLGKHLVKSGSQSNQNKTNGNTASGGTTTNCTPVNFGNNSLTDTTEFVLTWTEFGPDKYIDDKEIHSILKSLIALQHPYIEPIKYAASNETGCLVVRNFYKQGSLKDMLCISTPKNPYLSKYGNCKNRSALSLKQVAIYGRQIIEALRFLHSKGMPFGHLQTGNILIVDDNVRLLDIENYILGVPAFYRPFFVQHSKIHTAENIDVYCFGHILFEMSMGYPLQESIARQINECPESLKNLLESILSKEACKTSLPSLNQLSEHKFFTEYASSLNDTLHNSNESSSNNKVHFKLSTNAKEQIKIATQKAELRLQNEQKSVKNQKRLVRVQELMSSEEEKKKSKQKAKLEHKQSKLKQQASLQMQNGPSLSLATTSSSFGTSTGSTGEPRSPLLNKTDSTLSVHASQETLSSPPSIQTSPLPPPPPMPPTLPPNLSNFNNSSVDEVGEEKDRSALLESICRFNRGSLRKVRSNDD